MALLLTEADVRVLLDMPTALEAVEESLRRQGMGDAWPLPRRRLVLPDNAFLNDMAGADRAGGWMGVKVYTVARGVARFVVLLFRADTGELAAVLEADYLGQMRTGAATGVATRYMSRADSRIVGLIGAGLQARSQLAAVSEVRKLEEVRVFSRDSDRRADFCQKMNEELGLNATPATSAEEAVRGADIVITATNSVKPVLHGEWLAPGTHVNAMGANNVARRELESDVVTRAAIVAVDSKEQARMESGDLIQVFGDDLSGWGRVCELGEIVAGKIPGRSRPDEITLFKSLGIGTWDIATAARVFERAKTEVVGREIDLLEKRR
jgi:alanine dehydrogenase